MRSGALTVARSVLLAGPVALAFFSGGYFDSPRAWAGLIAWLLVATAIITGEARLPRRRGSRLALVSLALLAAWTLLSTVWAPIAGSAYHAGQRVVLYAGALLAAAALLRDPRAQRAAEPAVALGTLIVIGYGLSERFLPGLLTFQHSVSAQGRLEQPLTYWNAMGAVAAIGLVLCAHLAGDAGRSLRLRVAAAAASAPLGMGLYLTFSRGSLYAYASGLVVLLVLAPRREQIRAAGISLAAATLGALAAAPFRGVVGLTSGASTRQTQGAIALVLLAVVMAVAAAAEWYISRRPTGPFRLPRHAPVIALVVLIAGLSVAIAVGAKENTTVPLTARASRFATLHTSRYSYWNVALRAFSDEPIRGVGAGGWAVYWLRYRPINEFSQDAHSLPIQTLAELGIVGLALLLAFLAGIALAARDALRAAPSLAAGPIAGSVVWVAHSPLDWDWQMPAVTLMALLLAGAIVALAESTARTAESLASGSLEDPQRLAPEELSTGTGFAV